MELDQDQQMVIDSQNAQMEDILNPPPPEETPVPATPPAPPEFLERTARRSEEISGVVSSSNMLSDEYQAPPVRVREAFTQPLTPKVIEENPGIEESYYSRFLKYDDSTKEQANRQRIENSIGFLIPNNPKEAIESQGRLPITVSKIGPDGEPVPGNFSFVRFRDGTTAEQRGALMASQGGYYYAHALKEGADPMAFDDVINPETNPEGQYGYVAPRYLEDIRGARTPAEGFTPLTATLLAKETPGRGYETLIPILNDLSTNPADQAALIALEESGDIKTARSFQGARDLVGFVLDAAGFLATPFTESATYEESLQSGLFLYGEPQADIAKATAKNAVADAKVQEDMRTNGMMVLNETTGRYEMNPEYTFDYIGALEAEGFSPEAASSYWMYARDAEDRAYRFLGEEVPLAVVTAGFRYGLALTQVARFNTWINRTHGSADEAFKKGLTGGELAAAYLQTFPDRTFSNWARGMSANSMRINLSVYKNSPNFSAANQIKVQAKSMEEATTRYDALLLKRDQTTDVKEIKTIQAQMDAERKTIDKLAKSIDAAQGEVFRGTWLGDTFRTSGYGILGASVAGQVVSDHFDGGEGSQAIAEVLGFMSEHTATNIFLGGTKKALQTVAYGGDAVINTGAAIFGILDPDLLRRAGAYDEFSFSLSKQQKRVLASINNLDPLARQAVVASATYVNDLQNRLGSLIDERTGQPFFDDDFLEQTLGVVTGLNVLLLAERQLARGVDVGEITDMGSQFYAKEEVLRRKSELSARLNGAVTQLLQVANTSTDKDIRTLANGLAEYNADLRSQITRDLAEVENTLNERFGLIESALSGNQEALRVIDPSWKMGDPIPDVSEYLIRDDESLRKVYESIGMPAEQINQKLSDRMLERLNRISEAANVYARDYGKVAYGGADNLGTYQYYITRSMSYQKASQPYDALYTKYGDTTLMDVTSFYDEVHRDPTQIEGFNVPPASSGASSEAGITASKSHLRNWAVQFNDAADRTMAQLDGALEQAAVDNDLNPSDLRNTLYGMVGLSENSAGIEKWERIRAALRGDTSVDGVSEESVRAVRRLVLRGDVPGSGKDLVAEGAEVADDAALAEAGRRMADQIPLAITLQEFAMFKRGLNASIRKEYARDAGAGAGALEERGMVDRLDELAESGDGFYDDFFNRGGAREASMASTELNVANRTFQVEWAQRHMRQGTPGEKIGKGVSPREATPSLVRAGATGRVKPDQFFNTLIGDLNKTDPFSGGAATTSTVIRVNNELAQVAGQHFEEPITIYTGGRGQREVVIGDRGGHYQLVEGDPSTEALRGALKVKMLEVIRNSPAAAPLRKALAKSGALTPAQAEEARRLVFETIQKGDPLFDETKLNMNLLFSVSELKMLRLNEAGSYTQVPLLDMDGIFREVSLDTMIAADEEIRGLASASISEYRNTVAKMKQEFKLDARNKEYANDTVAKAIQDLDADPQGFFFKQFDLGDPGFTEVENIETLIRQRVTAKVNRDIEAGEVTREEGLAEIEKAVDAYKGLRKEYFGTWLRSTAEKKLEGSVYGIDPETGKKGIVPNRGFSGSDLLDAIGAGGAQDSEKKRAIFDKMTDGDDELYQTLKDIGDWAVLNQAKMPGGMTVDGVPTGLSIESWISRIYSINRGVVSPRYVGAEALIQSFRMQGLSLLEAMVNDKKLAKKVQEILVSGKPLKTEQENFEFFQALSVAAGLSAIRLERAAEAQADTEDEDEKTEIVIPGSINEQMDYLMA